MKSIIKNNKGISIIELVLVIAIIGIVLQVVYSLYFVGGNSFAVSNNKGFSQQGVRNVSMFLEGELKHASGFLTAEKVNEGINNTRFYGLKRDSDVFVVEQYDYISETEPMYEVSELKRYPITWEELILKNDDFGKLNVFINQSETSGGLTSSYELNFSMDLLNAHLVKTDNEWNFQVDDTVLYYTKTIDSDMGSIKLNESVDSDPLDPEDGDEGIVQQINISAVVKERNNKNDPWSIVTSDVNGNHRLKYSEFKVELIIDPKIESTQRIIDPNGLTFTIDSSMSFGEYTGTVGNKSHIKVDIRVVDRTTEGEKIGEGNYVTDIIDKNY